MPEAKVLSHPSVVKHAQVGQPGARIVTMPTAVSHASPLGARIVGGPAHPAAQMAQGTSTATVIQRPPNAGPRMPRPRVAPRPSAMVRPGSTNAVVLPPRAQATPEIPLTPLTIDQGMFLTHLVDGFLLSQKDLSPDDKRSAGPEVIELANGTLEMLAGWMNALGMGTAKSAPLAPAAEAPTPASPAA